MSGRPADNVSLFANYSPVQALLLDCAPSLYVPNVPVSVANVGVDFDLATVNAKRMSGEAYVTLVGKKNVTQDGLLTTSPFARVAGVSPTPGRKAGRYSGRPYGIPVTG